MAKWTMKEVSLLRQYYPDYNALVRLLDRGRDAIMRKAHAIGISKGKKAVRKSTQQLKVDTRAGRRPVLIRETKEIVIHRPSYSRTMAHIEYHTEQSLAALRSAKTIYEWARSLDEYNYWLLRCEQAKQNKVYYTK